MPEVIIVPSFFLMVAYVVWVLVTGWQRRQRLRLITEFNSRLLDRLGSVKDFSEFLQTDAGAQFMNTLATETPGTRPQERILRATQIGIVLLPLGIGLLFLGWYFRFEGHDAFTALGVIVLSLGLGFLLASGVSYRIALALGVLQPARFGAPQASSQ
jgi:TRAP-type mannitol/chloroaromatic compound transport system permease large subunit